jgi:hypothetical protein
MLLSHRHHAVRREQLHLREPPFQIDPIRAAVRANPAVGNLRPGRQRHAFFQERRADRAFQFIGLVLEISKELPPQWHRFIGWNQFVDLRFG